MTCRHCQSFFCWLCNELINGYEHFNNINSPCYGLLFEGLETDNVMIDMDMIDMVDDINQFFENLDI